MDWKAIPWILIALGYVGFEASAVMRSQHRFEPLFTFDRFVSMHHASRRCGDPEPEQRARFERNLAAVTERARRDLAATHAPIAPGEVERMLTERDDARAREVDALVEAGGCDDPELWTLLKRYEQRARLNIHLMDDAAP